MRSGSPARSRRAAALRTPVREAHARRAGRAAGAARAGQRAGLAGGPRLAGLLRDRARAHDHRFPRRPEVRRQPRLSRAGSWSAIPARAITWAATARIRCWVARRSRPSGGGSCSHRSGQLAHAVSRHLHPPPPAIPRQSSQRAKIHLASSTPTIHRSAWPPCRSTARSDSGVLRAGRSRGGWRSPRRSTIGRRRSIAPVTGGGHTPRSGRCRRQLAGRLDYLGARPGVGALSHVGSPRTSSRRFVAGFSTAGRPRRRRCWPACDGLAACRTSRSSRPTRSRLRGRGRLPVGDGPGAARSRARSCATWAAARARRARVPPPRTCSRSFRVVARCRRICAGSVGLVGWSLRARVPTRRAAYLPVPGGLRGGFRVGRRPPGPACRRVHLRSRGSRSGAASCRFPGRVSSLCGRAGSRRLVAPRGVPRRPARRRHRWVALVHSLHRAPTAPLFAVETADRVGARLTGRFVTSLPPTPSCSGSAWSHRLHLRDSRALAAQSHPPRDSRLRRASPTRRSL